MTQTINPADPAIRDFSAPVRDVRFNIAKGDRSPDVFTGINDLPAELLIEFAAITDQLEETDIAQQPEIFRSLFSLILVDESYERFNARMRDKTNPISITQLMEIMPWVMEQYGLRPTTPSEDSSGGLTNPVSGTNSTAPAPVVVSIPDGSTPSDSST